MINSRAPEALIPEVKAKWLHHQEACKSVGIEIILISTYRDAECQNSLYAQGRTTPGKIVTNAKAGESYHNYKLAYDILILRKGKPVWDSEDKDWGIVGKLGEQCGLEWAGRWKGKLQETAHFQQPGYTLASLQKLKLNTQLA